MLFYACCTTELSAIWIVPQRPLWAPRKALQPTYGPFKVILILSRPINLIGNMRRGLKKNPSAVTDHKLSINRLSSWTSCLLRNIESIGSVHLKINLEAFFFLPSNTIKSIVAIAKTFRYYALDNFFWPELLQSSKQNLLKCGKRTKTIQYILWKHSGEFILLKRFFINIGSPLIETSMFSIFLYLNFILAHHLWKWSM